MSSVSTRGGRSAGAAMRGVDRLSAQQAIGVALVLAVLAMILLLRRRRPRYRAGVRPGAAGPDDAVPARGESSLGPTQMPSGVVL